MRFIVTQELGRLTTWLRILGFDTILEKNKRDLVIKSLREDRIIVTRDSKMSRFTGTRMVKIKSDFVEEQVEELVKDLDIRVDKDNLFTLCVLCNERLKPCDKEDVRGKVPEHVFETQSTFMMCPHCQKIYWHGTHWVLVNKFLERLK